SPIGYSSSGQIFNLPAEELAADVARQINADKLIMFADISHVADADGQRISTLTPAELERTAHLTEDQKAHFACLARAVRGGVTKAHAISFLDDGALLAELFTAEGVGTQIVEQQARTVRQAVAGDVAGIVEMIRPLEESGVLVRRERDRLEQEIELFLVAELDGIVVGCCAIYPYGEHAELACLAVHENYRSQSGASLGQSLLQAGEAHARQLGASHLFVLTTQTQDWFLEQGFSQADVQTLPEQKQNLYNWQRNSIVMAKPLS
ncbi:MAG: amino-acid N-acetyltransferase, partial [Pseudomonadota bacterium]